MKNSTADRDVIARDDELTRRVKLYLGTVRCELSRLQVWACAGTVHLAGAVRTFYARQLAISAAARVAGVSTWSTTSTCRCWNGRGPPQTPASNCARVGELASSRYAGAKE